MLQSQKQLVFSQIMSEIQVLKSSRGNPMLYYSGYFYTQHQVTEKNVYFVVKIGTVEVRKNLDGFF